MLAAISKQGIPLPPDFQARLDSSLLELRQGDARKALENLLALEKQSPEVSSLTYLVALAAMQAGDPSTASAKADQSMAKRERVSDSLALKAVLETQKSRGGAKLGDPSVRAEGYLRQAMVADAANPSPYVELATLLRYRKRDEEAMRLLQSARSRLTPVDSHMVIDATIALLNLQNLPDADLPADTHPNKDPASRFSAAYIAMRKGDFALASTQLRAGREQLPADLFFYLVNDPAMRKFSLQPEVAEFFK
jgi:thioredoxin-like negative regulator of GroEL